MLRTCTAFLLAILAFLSASSVSAFGLGELSSKSYLNQPFEAQIELINLGDLNNNELIAKLAGLEDFANVGIQRQFFLNNLNFKVVFDDQGGRYIQITTDAPVTEPFLNFLIEVIWPEGRLLREFTVLLDPPSYAAESSVIQQPVVTNTVTKNSPVVVVTNTSPAVTANTHNNNYRVYEPDSGETLWGIASRNRPSESVSIQQTMLAIQALNQDSFTNGNINYLKKAQVLRLPTEEEVRELSVRDAMSIVSDQNRDWLGRTAASGKNIPSNTAKLVGSSQVTPMEMVDTPEQMKLVADNSQENTLTRSGGVSEGGQNADEIVRIRRENERLLTQNNSLQNQLSTGEQLIALKDQELAQLRSLLQEQSKEIPVTEVLTEQTVDEVNDTNNEQGIQLTESESNLEKFTEDATATTDSLSEDLTEVVNKVDEVSRNLTDDLSHENEGSIVDESTENGESVAKIDSIENSDIGSGDLGSNNTGSSDKDSKIADSLIDTTEQISAEPKSFIDKLLAFDLPIIGGIVSLVVLLLGLLGFSLYRRRTQSAPDFNDLELDLASGLDSELGDGLDELDGLDNSIDSALDLDDEGMLADISAIEPPDLLTQADTHMAEGRYADAASVFKDLLNDDNTDTSVKLKLLEAYVGLGDKPAFDNLSAELLLEDPDQQVVIAELAQKIDPVGFEGLEGIDEIEDETSFDASTTLQMKASDFDLDNLDLDNNDLDSSDELDISLDDLANDLDNNFGLGIEENLSKESGLEEAAEDFELNLNEDNASDISDAVSDLNSDNAHAVENIDLNDLSIGTPTTELPLASPNEPISDLESVGDDLDLDLDNLELDGFDDDEVSFEDGAAENIDDLSLSLDDLSSNDESVSEPQPETDLGAETLKEEILDIETLDDIDDEATLYEPNLNQPNREEEIDLDETLKVTDPEELSLDDLNFDLDDEDSISLGTETDEFSIDSLDMENLSVDDELSLDLGEDELSASDDASGIEDDALDTKVSDKDSADFDTALIPPSTEGSESIDLDEELLVLDDKDLDLDEGVDFDSEDDFDFGDLEDKTNETELELSLDDVIEEPQAQQAQEINIESFAEESTPEDSVLAGIEIEENEIDLELDFDIADEEEAELVLDDEPEADLALQSEPKVPFETESKLNMDIGELTDSIQPNNHEEAQSAPDINLDNTMKLDMNNDSTLLNEASDEADSLFADNDDFDLLDEGGEVATKLDLARAYIDMGDDEGAKDILDEVVVEGDAEQQKEAQALLGQVKSS